MAIDKTKTYSEVEVDGELLTLAGGGAIGAIIRTAELANIDITLSKNGTTIETKNTGAGGKVEFNVSEIGTYTLSTSTWSKDVVVEELNTIVKAYAGTLADYTFEQIHEACQGGYASLMWKPKDQWTYPNDSSIYANRKIMITKIKKVGDKEQIKWCLADKLSTNYSINPQFGYLTSSTATSWSRTYSSNGGMKYSAMEQSFKVQGEEVYSQARGLLPEDYSGTLTTGIKPSELYYTDQNGTLCKVYDYDKETDSFVNTNTALYPTAGAGVAQSDCKFIKGYFKSVGTIDEQTFNGGYYYTYDSSNYVYTRATTYTSGTTYYGLYETLQEDGVLIPQAIRQYLVKEERKASAGGRQQTYLSSFSDYANLLAVEEITGLYSGLILPSGAAATSAQAHNLHGEGEKEEGFDFETQTTTNSYWTRSTYSYNAYAFCTVNSSGYIYGANVYTPAGARVCFTTN